MGRTGVGGERTIEDVRRTARRRLPRPMFDFVEGGADDERTSASNEAAFDSIRLYPRVLVDVSRRDQSTTLLGRRIESPIVLGPAGLARSFHPDGERGVAAAASRCGVPYVLSSGTSMPIEEVASAGGGCVWFQLYFWRDRERVESMLAQALDAGVDALFVTVDTPVIGARRRDARNGLIIPFEVRPRNVFHVATHPRWAWETLRSTGPTFGAGTASVTLAERAATELDPSLSWKDLAWIRERWPRRVAIKGILRADDAARAVDAGADAIVVSNHGGRQLDTATSSIGALPAVVARVGGAAQVIHDGGVRRGTDIIKALALGADACMIGRPYLYGLAAAGEAGVECAVRILADELDRALALVGCPTVGDLDRSIVAVDGGVGADESR